MFGNSTVPLLGREKEMEMALNRLGRVTGGTDIVLSISGEAGIGKSRFIREFVVHAKRIGFDVYLGHCPPDRSEPLKPLTEIFEKLEWPNLLQKNINLERATYQMLDILRDKSKVNPMLIILEDVHWADASTLNILLFLARNLKRERICFVISYRTEELLKDIDKTNLLSTIRQLVRENLLTEISLGPLPKDKIGQIVEKYLEGPLDSISKSILYEESEGNPLYIMELLKLYSKSKIFSFRTNTWVLNDKEGLTTSGNINQLILRRCEWLTERQARIMEFAATIGIAFDPKIVSSGLEIDLETILDELDQMEKRFDLIFNEKNYSFFTHERVRSALLSGISYERRKDYHLLIAQVIEEKYLIQNNYATLSTHYYQAEAYEECVEYSMMAGKEYLRLDSAPEAIHFFKSALSSIDFIETNEELIRMKREAFEGMAEANIQLIHYDESIDFFNAALNLCTDGIDRARILRKYSEALSKKGFQKQDLEQAERLLVEAYGINGIEVLEKAENVSMRAGIRYFLGDAKEAIELSIMAEGFFRDAGELDKLAWEKQNRSIYYLKMGDIQRARQEIKEAHDLIGPTTSRFVIMLIYFQFGELEGILGNYASSIEFHEKAIEIAGTLGNSEAVSYCELRKAFAYESMANIQAALISAKIAYDHALKSEHWYTTEISKGYLAHYNILNGNLDEAEMLLNELIKYQKGTDRLQIVMIGKYLPQLALGELLCSKGMIMEGAQEFDDALGMLRINLDNKWFFARFLKWAGFRLLSSNFREVGTKYLLESIDIYMGYQNQFEVDMINEMIKKDGKKFSV